MDRSNSSARTNSSKSSYPNMELLFKRKLLYFPYLTGPESKPRNIFRFIYLMAWPCIATGVVRNATLAGVKKYPKLSISLSDPTFFIGDAGFWLVIVCFFWSLIAVIIRYFYYKSNQSIQFQHWIYPLTVLEKRENVDHKTLRKLINIIYSASKFIPISGSFSSWTTFIPIILGFPKNYLTMTLIWSLITACYAYIVSAWVYNFALLLGFYLYYCGHRFEKLSDSFDCACGLKTFGLLQSNKPFEEKKKKFDGLVSQYTGQLINLCKEIDRSEIFWYPVNDTIFMGTFLAETLLLYLAFFADVLIFDRVAVIFLGILTLFYGQSISFLSGIFLQHKFDKSVYLLRKCLQSSKKINPLVKIQSLIALDYLANRHLFYVYWCINVSSWSYLKVQIEVVGLLLLLIANSNR